MFRQYSEPPFRHFQQTLLEHYKINTILNIREVCKTFCLKINYSFENKRVGLHEYQLLHLLFFLLSAVYRQQKDFLHFCLFFKFL